MALRTSKEKRNGDTCVKLKIIQATRNQINTSFVIKNDILPKIVPKQKNVRII